MTQKSKNWWLFWCGLFSLTQIQVVGSIAISELAIFLIAPFVWLQDLGQLKRDGFSFCLWLLVGVMAGCWLSGFLNHTPFVSMFKGFAAIYALWASIVVLHRLVRKNYLGIKWFFVGAALSGVINVFIFQQSVEVVTLAEGVKGIGSVEAIMSGPIFWIGRLKPFAFLPINGWYLQTPILYSALAPLGMAAFSILTTVSGRSASLGALAAAIVVFVGGKDPHKMMRISKHFVIFMFAGLVMIFLAKVAYTELASGGHLGEAARKKFEAQTRGKTDMLSVLMGGRGEFFCGLTACIEKPVVGYGPWARDYQESYGKFVEKYGTLEDIKAYYESRRWSRGMVGLIPGHSHIVGWWLWYGGMGLVFWLYVLYLYFNYFRKCVATYPPWFGFLAASIPATLWSIFFSPFSGRIAWGMILVGVLFVKAMREKRVSIPYEEFIGRKS